MARLKKLILVIDDDDAVRWTTAQILRQSDYAVIEAANGKVGLRLAGLLPDLVLLDLQMPEVSGWQVLRGLKTVPRLARIPVITTSGVRGIGIRAEEFVQKPVSPEVLLKKIEQVLLGDGSRRCRA